MLEFWRESYVELIKEIKKNKFKYLLFLGFYGSLYLFMDVISLSPPTSSDEDSKFALLPLAIIFNRSFYVSLCQVQLDKRIKAIRTFFKLSFANWFRYLGSLYFVPLAFLEFSDLSETSNLIVFLIMFLMSSYFYFRATFLYQVVMIGEKSIFSAFGEAYRFTEGKFWKVMGPYFIIVPLIIMLLIIIEILFPSFALHYTYMLLFLFFFYLLQNVQYKLLAGKLKESEES
jgi:hypothetical protein